MNQADPLESLRDIHLMPNPSFWPLALGWWILISLFILLIFIFIFLRFKNKKKTAIKKDLYNNLKIIEKKYIETKDESLLQEDINILLRRFLLSIYQAKEVNQKSIMELEPLFLKHIKVKSHVHDLIYLASLHRFEKDPKPDANKLLALTKTFVKKCKI